MTDKTALGDRMKGYEKAFNTILPKRIPIIVRVDGRCFHSLLKSAKKPFDEDFVEVMNHVASELLKEVQGAVFAYVQSDEISLLVINYSSLEYSPFFNNELQKIVASTASIATRAFNESWKDKGLFDSKVFILPKEEVCNYFLWRQRDWTRNSVQMVARSFYTQAALNNKNNSEMQEMIFKKGTNWNALPVWQKRGRCFCKKNIEKDGAIRTSVMIDEDMPIFSGDRDYINKFVFLDEIEKELNL